MTRTQRTFDEIHSDGERMGVIGSPSETSGIKVDILGHSVDRRLVGALTYFVFNQEAKRHCALGQITEITLRNPWVEDATMRSLIRQKGRVDPITGRQDTHTATMTIGAVFAEGSDGFEQGELGTIPATGTEVKEVGNELLDRLLAKQEEVIYKIGRIYGTNTYFPAWFRHFGEGKGGKPLEFYWEREWRVPGDLRFRYEDIFVGLATSEEDAKGRSWVKYFSQAIPNVPFIDPQWSIDEILQALRARP